MQIVLVAAIGENNVIGGDGHLPWRLKSDLKHFRRLTMGKPVIMGRKTFESIGKPLDGRTNIVLTRNLAIKVPGGVLATSLDAALGAARDDARKRGVDEIMVIGGGDVFADTMPLADRLEITHVHASPKGDAYFPPIDPAAWREVMREEHPAGPDDSASFTVAAYLRR
ncbi:MAG TPA: dihydrofolate reductase [Pseudolabrys sp.]|nr:dihydrofolate reductase [Pseudolabrys sp.]